jgi:hypothetical protein
MPKRKPTDIVPLQVRMPEALRQNLAVEAERNQRSLNGEIVWRLGQTFGEDWQKFIAQVEQAEAERKAATEALVSDPETLKKVYEVLDRITPDWRTTLPDRKKPK